MNYQETMNCINSLLRFGSRPGLERILKLLELLGNPQDKLKFVHVAGTNGKGTTCTLLSSVLTSAGYKTGLYISPYIIDFRERMQINGQMIPQEELTALVEKIYPLVQQMAEKDEIITEFEFITAIALQWFAEQNCDIVVLEVGLGGRFDATNVIQLPEVSVIASISLDHTAILGDTIEKIAFEKCGIIKQNGVTVSFPEQKPAALEVIKMTATLRNNEFYLADRSKAQIISTDLHGTKFSWNKTELQIPFIGEHQVQNAVTALTTLEALQEKGYSIEEQAVKDGFSQAKFPARLELLSENPVFLLDGAHNPNGAQALADAIKKYLPGKNKIAVMGMLADKDSHTAIEELAGLFSHVITLTPSNPRALSAEELAHRWLGLCTDATPMENIDCALKKAIALAGKDGAVIVCGSLYLAADIRPHAMKLLNDIEK